MRRSCPPFFYFLAGTHDILKLYSSDGMAAQLYFTADAPDSRFFQSWDLDLVFDVLQVCLLL
jgi:hypothetical protein